MLHCPSQNASVLLSGLAIPVEVLPASTQHVYVQTVVCGSRVKDTLNTASSCILIHRRQTHMPPRLTHSPTTRSCAPSTHTMTFKTIATSAG